MGKHTHHADSNIDSGENFFLVDDFDFESEEYLEPQEKPLRRRSKRSKQARRLIEQYWEDRDLSARLDEYYYHTDD